ncbi:MAG: hypothetical protein IT384_30905 [Deltaproteobacteria bacterium]|nr:hypothetical protein [Deltaproteobacteria bacterium]
MPPAAWALLLIMGAPPSPGPIELIVLPPRPGKGIKSGAALAVWKGMTKQLGPSAGAQGLSLSAHQEAESAIAGPAKDQAWECALDAGCLADLGATLGGGFLIAGEIAKDHVNLVLIEVRSKKKIVAARSSQKLAKSGPSRQAEAAVRGILKGYGSWSAGQRAQAGATPSPPGPAYATSELTLRRDVLAAVIEVSIDEAIIQPGEDGAIRWIGPPGKHEITAVRADGARAEHTVTLEAGVAFDLRLDFRPPAPAASTSSPRSVAARPPTEAPPPIASTAPPIASTAPPIAAPGPARSDRAPISSQWWFWTSVGAAIAVGGATAALLLGGAKGGPSIDASTGEIIGSY